MYRPIVKISAIYLAFSLVYYSIFSIIFFSGKESSGHWLKQLLIELTNMFFWMNVHAYFVLSILASSLLGMAFTYYKKQMKSFKVFSVIFAITVLFVFVVSISSYF